ncbi:hypothetical protein PMZ80_001397 [Knufia obscura]|uniref:SAP domain-containing protein n=1 Tax=Knufia obscura TaxID=1635080 RepID=A0ABR0S320_9EURO|nr:hypothetical protein PMZ80_001397 [Knufia obscura]
MAAPRAFSFKALQNLSKPSKRSLHMTGSQSSPRAIDGNHKTTYLPWGLQELRQECRKRTLTPSGTKHELIDRLASHDGLQARAFSIAMRRIAKEQTSKPVSGPSETSTIRSFNTSGANKANSTVDFAYLPKLFSEEFGPQPAELRVPIMPNVFSDDAESRLEKFPELSAAAGGYQATDGGSPAIMKPEIETASEKNGAEMSHMSDIGDGQTTEMSVETLAQLSNILGNNAHKFVDMVKDKDESTIRKIWSGFLDDVFGEKQASPKA